MFATYVVTFMTLKPAIPIAASSPAPPSRIFPKTGYAPFVV